MTELVLRPLADAFLQVGVFVAVLVAVFGWARARHGDQLSAWLVRHARYGPAVGAVLGVSPGCGGAIVLIPLLLRGAVSYGTVVAALVATMGDSSWVLIAADPALALWVHLLLLLAGLVTGYAVDAVGWRPALPLPEPSPRPPALAAARAGALLPVRTLAPVSAHAPARATAPLAFWGFAAPGFLLAVPVVVAQADVAGMTALLGGVDPYLVLGLGGTLAAAAVVAGGRPADVCSGAGVARQSAYEASFVTLCVAAAYVGWAALVAASGFDPSTLALAGAAGVAVGAAVGLVPGCAVQIVFTGLFVSGALPPATLLANAVSQDGDALFPLFAAAPRAALATSAVTTVPAVVVGALALLAT